jgi:hypothetical protein
MSSAPHYEHNKEAEFPQGLVVGHKCNVTTQRPNGWESPNLVCIVEEKIFEEKKDDKVG